MNKLFLLLIFLPFVSYGQTADYETISFEIKAITLTNTNRSILSYDVKDEQFPTKIKKFDTRTKQEIYNANQPFMYNITNNFNTGNTKNPVITIAPLREMDAYAFGDNGTRVKNTVYKPSSGGNIFSAYCAAVYAANNPSN